MKMPLFERVYGHSSTFMEVGVMVSGEIASWLEACAGVCGLHLRAKERLKGHVFLASVRDISFSTMEFKGGEALVRAHLLSFSSSGALYTSSLLLQGEDRLILKGKFLMGKRQYLPGFDLEKINSYFREVMRCLNILG